MIFYNFCEYLENEFPLETIFRDNKIQTFPETEIPERCIIVRELGGTITSWFGFARKIFQIIVRDVDTPKAKYLAEQIFNQVHDRYGLILPAVTVNGVLFPQVQTCQATFNDLPVSSGNDDNGRAIFNLSLTIIYRREVR